MVCLWLRKNDNEKEFIAKRFFTLYIFGFSFGNYKNITYLCTLQNQPLKGTCQRILRNPEADEAVCRFGQWKWTFMD